MPSFVIDHQCPQCGAPAQLQETDRLFQCGFCRVRSFLVAPDVFRYLLPHKAPAGKELIYFPYWRFKGMSFACVPGGIKNRFVDISQQAIPSAHFPLSVGFRSQTQPLRFATSESSGVFLKPKISKADLLGQLNDQFGATLPRPILHQAFIGETVSLLYAPFYLDHKLVDAVLDEAVEHTTAAAVEPLLERRQPPDWPIHFLSTLCPHCGWDLNGTKETLMMWCTNCRSAWWPKGGKLERLKVAHVPDPAPATMYLPFWRIRGDIDGIELDNYADFVRVANLPKAPQEGWDKVPFYFWIPAFKVRPQNFIKLAAHVTTAQLPDGPAPGLPAGPMHGVSLPLKEAVESLTLILAWMGRPRRRMEARLPSIRIRPRRFLLVLLPFQERHHEWVHPAMNLAVSKNMLVHARNL